MQLNIFQKIIVLIYVSIIILICIYFIPFHGAYNGFNPVEGSYKVNKSYHSNIFDEGYGAISYFRLLFYLSIPSIVFYFLLIYLRKMNSLDVEIYKKKAKRELYVFFVFSSVILGNILYLYGRNEYLEIKSNKLNIEILETKKAIKEFDESLNYKHKIYSLINDYRFTGYSWGEDVFDSYLENDKGFLNSIYIFLKKNNELENISESTFNSRMIIKTPYEISILENKKNKLLKDLDDKTGDLRGLTFYDNYAISFNIISGFLVCFLLLYIIRPIFYFIKEMIKEVN